MSQFAGFGIRPITHVSSTSNYLTRSDVFIGDFDVKGNIITEDSFAGQVEVISGVSGAIINPNIHATIINVPQDGNTGTMADGSYKGQVKMIAAVNTVGNPSDTFIVTLTRPPGYSGITLVGGAEGRTLIWGGQLSPYWHIVGN